MFLPLGTYLNLTMSGNPSHASNLLDKLRSDKNLASQLGLEVCKNPPKNSGKRKSWSPLKTKKFSKTQPEEDANFQSVGVNPSMVHAQVETAQEEINNLPSTSGSQAANLEGIDSEDSDDLENLEQILCDDTPEGDASDHDSESSDDLELLGLPKSSSWTLPEKVKKFYLKACDLDLNKEVIDSLKDKYKGSDELESHFTPPRFSPALWSSIAQNQSEVFRLKSINKIQENLFLSMKPLLDCLSTADKETKSKLTESLQLICASNLHLSRFRRTSVAPHLKPDIRKQILALPVTHNSFFGEDFSKATDDLIKEQSSLDKIILKKPLNQRITKPKSQGPKQFFRSQRGNFSQRGRSSFRGSSKRGNNRPHRPRQNFNYSPSNQYPNQQ